MYKRQVLDALAKASNLVFTDGRYGATATLSLKGRQLILPANLSILKTGKAKAIRFSPLEAICRELDCQPGDILEYREEDE